MKSILIAIVFSTAVVPALAGSPVITDLEVTLKEDAYVASTRLIGGLTPKILEEIDAGLETTIGYRFEVEQRRAGLPNPTIAKHRVTCTVVHDALTRQYTLTRRIDDELQETRVTPDIDEMRTFLTVLEGLPVVRADELSAGETYELKARSVLGLVWRFYLIPWRQRTPWSVVPIVPGQGDGDDTAP